MQQDASTEVLHHVAAWSLTAVHRPAPTERFQGLRGRAATAERHEHLPERLLPQGRQEHPLRRIALDPSDGGSQAVILFF